MLWLTAQYSNWLSDHAFKTVAIVHAMSIPSAMHSQVFEILTQNVNIANKLRQGFVQCLEFDYISSNKQSNLITIADAKALRTELQAKEAVVERICHTLYPFPHNS